MSFVGPTASMIGRAQIWRKVTPQAGKSCWVHIVATGKLGARFLAFGQGGAVDRCDATA
jgi:hypothetical protein